MFGPWIVEETLGRGGFGVGHLVRHEATATLGVLKTPHAQVSAVPELVARFRREASLMRVMSPGPSRARMLDAHLGESPYYVVSEWVPSISFGERLGPEFPLAHALWWALDVTTALASAHENLGADGKRRQVLHRDVSLNNVLLGFDGRAVLIDFGIAASIAETRLTRAGQFLGTPQSAAPESFGGAVSATRETDLFGVGLLLYDALTGGQRGPKMPPPDAPLAAWAKLQADIERGYGSLAELRRDLSPAMVALVRKAMHPEPERRFRRAHELAAALVAALAELGEPEAPPRERLARDAQSIAPDRARRAAALVAKAARARKAPTVAQAASTELVRAPEPPPELEQELSAVRPRALDESDAPQELDFRVPVDELPAPPTFVLHATAGGARSRKGLVAAALAAAAVAALVASRRSPPVPADPRLAHVVTTTSAPIALAAPPPPPLPSSLPSLAAPPPSLLSSPSSPPASPSPSAPRASSAPVHSPAASPPASTSQGTVRALRARLAALEASTEGDIRHADGYLDLLDALGDATELAPPQQRAALRAQVERPPRSLAELREVVIALERAIP